MNSPMMTTLTAAVSSQGIGATRRSNNTQLQAKIQKVLANISEDDLKKSDATQLYRNGQAYSRDIKIESNGDVKFNTKFNYINGGGRIGAEELALYKAVGIPGITSTSTRLEALKACHKADEEGLQDEKGRPKGSLALAAASEMFRKSCFKCPVSHSPMGNKCGDLCCRPCHVTKIPPKPPVVVEKDCSIELTLTPGTAPGQVSSQRVAMNVVPMTDRDTGKDEKRLDKPQDTCNVETEKYYDQFGHVVKRGGGSSHAVGGLGFVGRAAKVCIPKICVDIINPIGSAAGGTGGGIRAK